MARTKDRLLPVAIVTVILVTAALVFAVWRLGLEYFDQHQGSFLVILTGVLGVATVFYMILTAYLVAETRLMRSAQTSPEVVISIWPTEEYINWIDLLVENVGAGHAYNIRFTLPAVATVGDANLRDIEFLTRGLPYLAPKQRIRFFITASHGEPTPPVAVAVNYADVTGEEHTRSYMLDLSLFRGMGQLGEPPLFEMAKEIKHIREGLDKALNGMSAVHVKDARANRPTGPVTRIEGKSRLVSGIRMAIERVLKRK